MSEQDEFGDDFFETEWVTTKTLRDFSVPSNLLPCVPQLLGTLGNDEIEALNRADLFTPDTSGQSKLYGQTGYDESTSEAELPTHGREELITYLADEDPTELRRNIAEYGLDLDYCRESMEQPQFLEFCRKIRRVYPSGNILSKRDQDTLGEGTTLDKFYFPELEEQEAVFFGNAHLGHKAVLIPGVVKNIDPAVTKETPMFRKGKVQEWKKHVKKTTKVIYSDAAVGDEFGFKWDNTLAEAYEEMYEAGYDVVYKNHISVPPVAEPVDWVKVRPHNEEIIVWLSKHRKPRRQYPDIQELKEANKVANQVRTEKVLQRRYKFRWRHRCWFYQFPFVSHKLFKGVELLVHRKPPDRYREWTPRPSFLTKFKKQCLEEDTAPGKGEPIYTFELPLVLMDYPMPAMRSYTLFEDLCASARKLGATLVYEDGFGWTAQ